jgi:Transcriptional regulator
LKESKKEKLKEFHRSNILTVAKKLFIEKGIAHTTMDDIAKVADYSKSTLYVYFKSKDEIYNNIIYENMLLLKQALESATQNCNNVRDCFFSICNAHVLFQDDNPLFFESMLNGTMNESDNEQLYKKMLELNNELNKIITDFLLDGIQKKQVRPDIDIIQTAFTLWAAICGLILVSYNKKSYIQYMNVDRKSFLKYGFDTLLNSIIL